MKSPTSSLLVLLLGLAACHAAYLNTLTRRGAIAPLRRGSASRSNALHMVAVKDIFSKYVEKSSSVQKTLTKVPPTVVDGGTAAAIAATAAAGFALTPSSRFAVNVVGGALGSTVGVLGRKRLVEERKKAVMPAVAALLAEGLQNVTPEKLVAIMKGCGVDKAEFQATLGELYLAYLDACLASPKVETSELSELFRMQGVLNLSPSQVGNKVHAAARNLYSRHRAYLEDTEENESKRILHKFVFLAERILRGDESEEGYRYETLRLQKLFGILANEWKAIAEKEEATPFYDKAISSAVLDGKPVTAEQLAAVRASLGISDSTASAMHLATLTTCATKLLQPEKGDEAKLSDAENERLVQASALLGVPTTAVDNALSGLTAPLYQSTFAALVAEPPAEVNEAVVSDLAAKLAVRQLELHLPDDKAQEIEYASLRTAAAAMLSEAVKFVRAQNVGTALEEVRRLLYYASQMTSLMSAMDHVDGDEDTALATLFGSLDCGKAKASEILSLYRVFMLSCLEELKISPEDSKALTQLRELLGISEEQAHSVYEASAGPIFRKAVLRAINDGMGSKDKVSLQQSLVDLALPEAITATIQLDVYQEQLKAMTEIKKIVDEEEAAELRKMRDFLDLTFEAVEPIHAAVFESAYSDSIKDVFKQTPPIPDEYWEGLEQLQERLGLSQATADSLFAKVAESKMKTLGQTAMEALEAKVTADQAAARKESGASTPEDEKGDLNINVKAGEKMLDEILAMVKFAEGTRILQESGIACSLRGQFEDRMLKELYRQFLIEAFSGKSAAKNERVFANMNKLSLVCGLEPQEIKQIHDDLGSAIYRQVCNKALQEGPLGVTERQTLASIKDTLGMEESKCESLIAAAQLFRVSSMVEQMFERSSLTAEESRKVRDMAELLGVDLLNDAKVSKAKLERMYIVELQDIIDSGELTPQNTAELVDICDPLHIDEETAGRLLDEVVAKRCAGGLLQAAALLRQNDQSTAIEEIEKLLKFAQLSPELSGVVAKSVSMRERNELALLYQASLLTAGSLNDAAKEKLDLFRQIAGLEA
ncbi:hypothetical protein AB1Y20_003908 [Prymnesium parvum]|uniref:Uncharacterized protein n=1 Tax=Prymnesium parvum TaxID=97485 RepID=A0AB34J558_PRYPA